MSLTPEYLEGVCEGCLSPERQQPVEITDIEIKKLFFEILNQVVDQNVENLKLRLCSECKSSIKKFLSFKRQVRDAHEILSRHLITSSQANLPPYLHTEAFSKASIDVSSTAKTAIDVSAESLSAPRELAFIKIEDGLDDGDCFVGDDQGDDEDFKTVLKPEISQPNQLVLRVSSKSKTADNFTESDDEPLKNKKKKGMGREKKGKKKKKEDATAPKIDRRKCPAPRREKPPGVLDTKRVRQKLQQLNVPPGLLQCCVLSWQEVQAERQRALASEAFTRHQYRCADCVLGFNHRSKLDAHMKKHDPSAGPLECSVCRVRCKHQHALSAHRRRHRVRWRCCACGHTSSRACVAADHAARAHAAPPPAHVCRLCGHRDTSLAKLRGHMKCHAERQRCELCGKTFRDRTSLRTHLFIHSGEKEFSCPRCDKRFLFKKAMEVHAVTHDAHAHLYCYECDVTFKNRMSFTQHMKYSLKHVDPAQLKYACTSCDKRFLKASRLQEHTLAVHLKATPLSCPAPGCSFACASRAVLRAHARARHRAAARHRNHVCHSCGKAYLTKKSLEGHLRAHSGERPFRCTLCSAAFGYEAALYNHTRLVHLKHKLGRGAPPAPQPPLPPAPDIP